MKKILILEKREGDTPLQTLDRFRENHLAYKDAKMIYAGRLDPMASGILVVLVDEEIKNKEKYLGLSKEYEFEILFGFATDTYDILGKVVRQGLTTRDNLKEKIESNLKYFTGDFIQTYPLYSSPTIKHARAGKKVKSPSREVSVRKLQFLKLRKTSAQILIKNIETRIAKVDGDFRQKEVLSIWRKKLRNSPGTFFVGTFKVSCSSGTYVRGIANSLGEKIGVPALAFSIKRTKVGKFAKID